MSQLQRLASILLLAVSGLIIGCAQNAPPVETGATGQETAPTENGAEAATPVAAGIAEAKTTSTGATPPGNAAAAPSAPEKAANATPAKDAAAKDAVVEAFQPPYPQRDNMFRRPSTDNTAKAARAENNNAVELKGFVNMGGLKAVLVIDGHTVSLKQGEQRGDIEVIEVTPPKVILQRGRNRWTTQLFDPAANKTASLSN